MSYAIRGVPVERLQLSKAPAAEISGAALAAQQASGLAQASFLVIAVDPDELEPTLAIIDRAVGEQGVT